MAIDRPKVAQLDALLATVAKIHRAEARLSALKEQAAGEARALAEITDKKLRIEAGFYAYWFAPEVSATDIALGATGRRHPAKLMKLAGAVSIGIPCSRCEEDLPIRSRNQMKEVLDRARRADPWPGAYRFLCVGCQNALDEERLLERMAECDAHDVRQRELAASPTPNTSRPRSSKPRETSIFGGSRSEPMLSIARHAIRAPRSDCITRRSRAEMALATSSCSARCAAMRFWRQGSLEDRLVRQI